MRPKSCVIYKLYENLSGKVRLTRTDLQIYFIYRTILILLRSSEIFP